MKKLSLEEMVGALSLKDVASQIKFAVDASTEYDEAFFILEESFGFDKGKLDGLSKTLLMPAGEKPEMYYDFVSRIKNIKESKDVFDGFCFIVEHLPLRDTAKAMVKLFGLPVEQSNTVAEAFITLRKMKDQPQTAKPVQTKQPKKKKRAEPVEIPEEVLNDKSLYREIWKPVFLPKFDYYVLRVENEEGKFLRYISNDLFEFQIKEHQLEKHHEQWTAKQRGLMMGEMNRLTKVEGAQVAKVKEGQGWKIIFLPVSYKTKEAKV